MRRVWKDTVRGGLRNQPVEDLHDYLDVHRNLDPFLERLQALVVSGRYRPAGAEVVTLEKGDGISRRLLLPWPGDALLLQTLVEVIAPTIRSQQPTNNAFYSRSQPGPQIEHVDGTFAYPWWILWPEFQQRIWRFAEACPYVVVTDVANYFDSIPLAGLRNALAAMGRFDESLLDFLFFMLEAFTWRPYYMPLSGVGLPQIDFEAPRLLAHAYLFVADEELRCLTGDKAVRWMDDIEFGASSIPEARRILGRLDALLGSYGVRLNSGKTEILNTEQAARHFWIQENRALTIIGNAIDGQGSAPSAQILDAARDQLHRRWTLFREAERVGQYNKVLSRYFTLFGKLQDAELEAVVPHVLQSTPKLRDHVLRYYLRLGFNSQRFATLEEFLRDGHCVDDSTVFVIARTIVQWRLPSDAELLGNVRDLARDLVGLCVGADMSFVAGLWLLAKYGSATDLSSYLDAHRRLWERSEWLARQVAAASPRLTQSTRAAIIKVLNTNGLREGLRVAAHLGQLKQLPSIDEQLRPYLLHPPHRVYGYPLAKVLLAIALLEGEMPDERKAQLQDAMLDILDDPIYRSLVGASTSRPVLPASQFPAQRSAAIPMSAPLPSVIRSA